MIEQPFSDLDAWVAFYGQAQIPVLRHTVQELERLRENADKVNGRIIANVILHDPLMTLRVLHYIEAHRKKRQTTDITTIERALMMIGIEPFFRDFQDLPQVEDQLKGHPKALLGLLKVINRARKAAQWSREWALARHDLDVDEITVATLLLDVAEILMWCFAPTLALKIRDLQSVDRSLRSSAAQIEVYQVSLQDLQIELSRLWHLPELLTTLMDHSKADNPRVRNVTLAASLARHSANGWDDAALPDDFKAIEELLHINHATLLRRLGLDSPDADTVQPQ
ncbi:MAG: HDOD domain-containing protein [Gammaproteobacteria bacterium]|nr:HDOD domain-containing protein [Gammaproteobacteria bacterium]MBU1645246.1 HDOD domain-containing protein [Gammaproteobacteria bacterium]MBU1971583.1 HDOD domain-containing protein [Gammaproteobacteria bacterium]